MSRNLGVWDVNLYHDGKKAEVENAYVRRVIDMENKSCSCGKWQRMRLPCTHVANLVASMRNPNWSDYVDPYFYVERNDYCSIKP